MFTIRQISYFCSHIAYPADDELSQCWIWTGRKRDGYGTFKVGGENFYAHRFAFSLLNGHIPEGLLVCHKCDERDCVNPDHLFLGDERANSRDAVSKDRKCPRYTHEVINAVRMDRANDMTEREIAAKYGMARSICSQNSQR